MNIVLCVREYVDGHYEIEAHCGAEVVREMEFSHTDNSIEDLMSFFDIIKSQGYDIANDAVHGVIEMLFGTSIANQFVL